MTPTEIILKIYRKLIKLKGPNGIPVNLRLKNFRGTVQEDPFDCWVERQIRKILPNSFEVYRSGALTTPDLVIRDKKKGVCVG